MNLHDIMSHRKVGLLVSIVVLAGLIVPMALAAPEPQEATTLRIGYLGPTDSYTANGAHLAMDQISSAGGITAPDGTNYRFELVPLATEPTAETFEVALNELLSEDLVAILGPDTNSLFTADTLDALVATGLPVLTPATGDTLTTNDAADVLFRTRAPERVYSYALATYLTEDLELSSIAVVQSDVESTEALLSFESILQGVGLSVADRIQVADGAALADEVQRLLDANPEAIVMWGAPRDAIRLLDDLRDGGWQGRFAYRHADEAYRAGLLPRALVNGVLGVSSWSYAYTNQTSRIFLREYVVAFGEVPDPLAVAAYDAIWFLRAVINQQGINPDAIREGLLGSTPRTLVQGTLHPVDYGNGDLIRQAMVYELGSYGGATVLARFDDTQRLPLEDAGDEVPVGPTPTPGPPTSTPFPTATLQGTWLRVTANVLNVRSGPGFNYDRIGQVEEGDLLRVMGSIPDYSWMLVDFRGGVGWVKTEYAELTGSLADVPINVAIPPTPTVGATLPPTLPPNPDIVIDTVVLQPSQPIPNQPFTATVTVRNAGGGAAGRFAIAATFQPGEVYASTHVEGLAAGQSVQAQLSGTLTGTGVFQVGVVADLNQEVPELNEDNNVYNLTYRADYALFAQQSGLQLSSGSEWDLYGGTPDVLWDGFNLAMRNGAKVGILSGVTYENVTYDSVSPAVVTNTTGLTTEQVNPGVIVGIITAEGQRAAMRIDNRQGETIWVSYRVYNGP